MKKNPGLIVISSIVLGALALSVIAGLLLPTQRPSIPYSSFNNKSDNGFWVLKEYVKRCEVNISENTSDAETKNSILFMLSEGLPVQISDLEPEIQKFLEEGNTVIMLSTLSIMLTDDIECNAGPGIQETEQSPIPAPYLSEGINAFAAAKDYGVFSFVPTDFSADLFIESKNDGENLQLPLVLSSRAKNGRIYFCAQGVFNNTFITDSEYAVFIRNIFELHNAKNAYFPIRESKEGAVQNAPLGFFLHKNIVFTFFHLILTVLLLVILYAVRFGNPVSMRKYGKRKITEHLDAVGGFWKQRNATNLCETVMTRYFRRMLQKCSGKLSEDQEQLGKELSKENLDLSATDILGLNLRRQEFLDKNLKRRIDHE